MGRLGAALVCLVFAIPFGGIGFGASWVVWRMYEDSRRAEQWVRVKADLDSFSHGKVAYHYKFNGTEYRGDRLGANAIGGRDNIGTWQDDMFNMLAEAKTAKKPIMVWVNPDNPAESMFDRQMRWSLAFFAIPFALGFGGVGVGALFMFFRTLVAPADASGQPVPMKSTRGGGVLAAWIVAFFWNVISFPVVLLVLPDLLAQHEYIWLLLLVFPLIGVLLLWGAITTTFKAIAGLFNREPKLPTLIVPKAQAPVNDGVFARGMLDDPRAAASGASTASIDTGDDGLPPAPDPAVAQFEKLSGKSLTAAEREQLDKMSPAARAMVGKLAGWLGKVKEAQDK